MKVSIPFEALAAVSLRSAIKYRRDWNRNSATVKLLQSLMPSGNGKKGFRLYVPIGEPSKKHYTIPPAVRSALKRAGFVATDYLAKRCVKINDVEQKNVFNIGKVIAKDEHAKRAFDNDPQLQNSKSTHQVVISCHPYDIIGMSTGRDWDKQSCMRIDDGVSNKGDAGSYHGHIRADVAEGTLVAYAIETSDVNVQAPKSRCLIKPFYDEDGNIAFRRETKVYGNIVPGFGTVLNKVIKLLNAEAPKGVYRLAASLYNDGIDSVLHHDHIEDEDSLTLKDVWDDMSVAEEYVQQQLDWTNADPENRSVKGIFNFLNRDYDESDEGRGELKETQVEAIAKMLRGNDRIKNEFQSHVLIGHAIPQVIAKIGHVAGFFDDLVSEGLDLSKVPASILLRLSLKDEKAADHLLQILEDESHGEDRLHQNVTEDEYIRHLLTGKSKVPPLDILKKHPKMFSKIYTAASAARFMNLFGDVKFGEGTYDILDEIGTDAPEKTRGEDFVDQLRHIGRQKLVMCFALDNVNDVSLDELYSGNFEDSVDLIAGRRILKTFQRAASANRRVAQFLDEVLFEQFKKIISNNPFNVRYLKDNVPAIREHMHANIEEMSSIDVWSYDKIGYLLNFDLQLAMHIADNGTMINMMSLFIDRLYNAILKYEGAPLTPHTTDMEFACQVVLAVDAASRTPANLAAKFDLTELEMPSLDELAEKYSKRSRVASATFTKAISNISVGGGVGGRLVVGTPLELKPDVIKNILIREAPLSFLNLDAYYVEKNIWQLMKYVQEIPDLYAAIGSIENLISNCEFVEPESVDRRVEEDLGNRGVTEDHPDYDDLASEALEKAEAEFSAELSKNNDALKAIEEIVRSIGEPDDIETAKFFFRKFDEEVIEERLSDIEDLQNEAADKAKSIQFDIDEAEHSKGRRY